MTNVICGVKIIRQKTFFTLLKATNKFRIILRNLKIYFEQY